jgi:prepilin-type N-terminal cleavage/methylation domain-containing protein
MSPPRAGRVHLSLGRGNAAAFTLIELSIVLVILGLLVGGILTGRALMRAAEIQSVITQYQNFGTAVDIFREKYDAMPGDMADATSLWGAADGGDGIGADCHGVASVGKETCNGNGDGYVGTDYDFSVVGTFINQNGELFRFWQHLANAGLIEGKFTGRTDSTSNPWILSPGKNTPPTKIGVGSWTGARIAPTNPYVYNQALMGTHTDFFPAIIDQMLFAMWADSNSYVLTTEEIYGIDDKIDDGKPGYGKINATKKTGSISPNCTTSDSAATAEYDTSNKTSRCFFYMSKKI